MVGVVGEFGVVRRSWWIRRTKRRGRGAGALIFVRTFGPNIPTDKPPVIWSRSGLTGRSSGHIFNCAYKAITSPLDLQAA